MAFTKTQLDLLEKVADLHEVPAGAYNIRSNSEMAGRNTTEHIDIVSKTDKQGIDIIIKDGTKNESVHIPVIISQSGIKELVYNDFFVGDDCDVLIVAGCGIHTTDSGESKHDGVHTFHIGKNSRVRYVEKHYGNGIGTDNRTMNPETIAFVGENSYLEFESVQIGGISNTDRKTTITADKNAEVSVTERLMTDGSQKARSEMSVILNGGGSKARIVSRSVAKGSSEQVFYPRMTGNCECFGHVQCDSIIMDHATVRSIPEICATHVDARLIHEAAIGKIAGDQLLKLMTLGLTPEEAEEKILNGFLA